MHKDVISIIVPVYNSEKYLNKCISSIQKQTYNNIEIILVDDGSSDNSGEICDSFAIKDDRIRVIHKKNGGLSSSRNAGLDIARGEYIGFVDSDDFIEPTMYEVLLKAILKYDADISCVGIIREDEVSKQRDIIRCPKEEKIYNEEDALEQILINNEIGISVWSKLYKQEIFNNIRFPLGKTNEDAAILIDTICDKKIVHTSKPLYHYITREGSITATFKEERNESAYNNAYKLIRYIMTKYPEIKEAGLFYLANTLLGIMISYGKSNKDRGKQYKHYYSEYKKYWMNLLNNKQPFKSKMMAVAARVKLLRLYYKIKNKNGIK